MNTKNIVDMVPIPGSEPEKTAGIADVLKRVAVGGKLSPSQQAFARKFIDAHGYSKGHSGNMLRKILIGPQEAADTLKARYLQGGILGKGGLIRGELAPSPELREALSAITSGRAVPTVGFRPEGSLLPKVIPGDYMKALGSGTGYLANLGFGIGLPTMGVYSALSTPGSLGDKASGIGESLGSGIGFLAAGPLGLLGSMAAGSALGSVGRSIGKIIPEQLPEEAVMQNVPLPPQLTNPHFSL